MKIPAICDNCGTIFESPIEANYVMINNCRSGPCPKCGSMGHIPDGMYKFIGNTIELINGSNRTVFELKRLVNVFSQARKNKLPLEQVGRIIKDEAPELSSLKDLLPTNRKELYMFISIIIAIISLIIMLKDKGQTTTIEINQVITNVYLQQDIKDSQEVNTIINNINQKQSINNSEVPNIKNQHEKTSNVKTKIGRNDPCPCGSGKKYKKCCGK